MTASWVTSANTHSDFSLANIPFGIIISRTDSSLRPAIAIGSSVLDLRALSKHESFPSLFPSLKGHEDVFSQPSLNAFAALGRPVHREVRKAIQELLAEDTPHASVLKENESFREVALLPQQEVRMRLPMEIGDYTDFYAGIHHARAVGTMFRGAATALQPNYTHLPVGYHGRASSVVVSGSPVRRPWGQIRLDPAAEPTTAPSRKLDMEVELGCFLCKPNEMGAPIKVEEAEDYIFGYVLMNDWSARDVQTWEYVPLGPFNGKNFATTISPWVVLADALEPFRTKGVENETPLQEYLREKTESNVFDIRLEVDLTSTFFLHSFL